MKEKGKSLSVSEQQMLAQQVKRSEKKLRKLKFENDDLIDKLNEESHSKLIKESDLFKIPKVLRIKSNRCELMKKVDIGGYASVYKMHIMNKECDENGDMVAFKQFLFSNLVDTKVKAMIEKEIELLSLLKHDNITKIIGVVGDPDSKDINNSRLGIGIIMEYCENGSLRSFLNKYPRLDMNLIIHLLLDAAKGLEYLHYFVPNAIIHDDIKSDNILIDREYNAKLSDFGISKFIQSTVNTNVERGGIGGTFIYKAPESFDGKTELKSDVYSFGCIILEMLTGERPWGELRDNIATIIAKILTKSIKHNLSKVREDSRQELRKLMKRCLNFDKDKQPTIKQVRIELEKMMNNSILINLVIVSSEYKRVEDISFPGDKEGSLSRSNYKIIRIEKVKSRFAEDLYQVELRKIQSMIINSIPSTSTSSSVSSLSLEKVDANELLLFHGTSLTNPMIILNHPDSFMKDHGVKGFYGRGLYFAALARYSNNGFAYAIPKTKQFQILVCSVICGKLKEYGTKVNVKTKGISQKALGIEYHSIHAGPYGEGQNKSSICCL